MKNNKISEKELDSLLNRAFLDLDFSQDKNSRLIESIAYHALASKTTPSFTLQKFFLNKLFLFFAMSGIVLFVAYYFAKKNKAPENGLVKTIPVKNHINDSTKVILQEVFIDTNHANDKPFIDKEVNQVLTYMPLEKENTADTLTEIVVYHEITAVNKDKKDKPVYVFPKLTEKEIKETIKEKKRIVKLATKLSKERYALIPGKNYYLQTTEVSNLEYRTFLFDLLIQGRNEDFLKAKPEQSLWLGAAGINKFDNYKDAYFSDIRFNGFPVVNISQEGAEMYCTWLSELVVNSLSAKNKKGTNTTFKLPDENEWIYAAKAGKVSATYPWGRDSIQNNKNRFLANFCVQKLKEQFNQPIVYPSKINKDAYTSAGLAICSDTIATVHVYSYNPNDYYLYCMSGNVSEMVYVVDSKIIKTKGGNWASDFEHLKINSEDEFKMPIKPSPMIGFRVLVNSEN